MAGRDNFQLAIRALAKMVQDGTIIPILKPKMRVAVNGPATALYAGEERTAVRVHDENSDLEKGTAMTILEHCGFKRSTIRELMEDAEIQDTEGIIDRHHCKS